MEQSDDDTTSSREIKGTSLTASKRNVGNTTKKELPGTLLEQVAYYKDQIAQEKAGKRKLFHSMVKIANELRASRELTAQMDQERLFLEKNWYEGGLWRAPTVLPAVSAQQHMRVGGSGDVAISLSDLFFNLVIVTAFTRVGVAISVSGTVDVNALLYFAVFWTVWSKETSYSTRFDTTDLSARVITLVTCFAVLFACLSVSTPIQSTEGTRIMVMAAAVAILHFWLYIRVAWTTRGGGGETNIPEDNALVQDIRAYAIFNIVAIFLEITVWMVGIFVFPENWEYRWAIYTAGVVLALRVPRAFLANDFHAACSKRSVLFILLLGFLLQSVVVVASEFFSYQTPTLEDYSFIGSACLLLFCVKLLYVDDSDGVAKDHALLVNRWAGFFFNVGQFGLLLSTTVMGSGLNLLTHSYLAATAALPGPSKTLVCGGFSAQLFFIFFMKSMHLKRIPTDPLNQKLFVGAYVIQTVVLLVVVAVTAAMCLLGARGGSGMGGGGYGVLEYLMNSDIELLFALSLAAMVVVLMSWLDEGVELALYKTAADSRAFRIHPFGFWWCLRPDVSQAEIANLVSRSSFSGSTRSLSVLSPLLGDSAARDLNKLSRTSYNAV